MKRIIRFDKAFLPTTIVSVVLIVAGLVGYFVKGGFNLGVDFQAGLVQEIQVAPTALQLTYSGKGVAAVSASAAKFDIVVSGSDVENATYSFPFAQYATIGALKDGLSGVPGISASLSADASVPATTLIQSAQENPRLGADPYAMHYLLPGAEPVALETVRSAVASVGNVSVQVLGDKAARRFMIRVEDPGDVAGFSKEATEKISAALAAAFGADNISVSRTDFVGARFSKNLTDQAAMLVGLTLVLILAYAWFRFKAQFAIGAVLAILHDALIMVAFMAWTRMEFSTSSIAAILTILGYSINDTIVIFDRIREDTRLYPEESPAQIINRSVSEMLGRTVITTATTMIAVLSLFFFTTGTMKDFALALIVGMISGVYSTIFIASAFIHWWDVAMKKRTRKAPQTKVAAEPKKA
jgi:preprotein translocase subunit SecF